MNNRPRPATNRRSGKDNGRTNSIIPHSVQVCTLSAISAHRLHMDVEVTP